MARWLLAGPADEGARRLATLLGILPEQPGGHGFISTESGPAALAAAGTGGWEALIYQPRRLPTRGGVPARPDLRDADAFLTAWAEQCGATAPRLVLLSSAAAYAPSHHNVGFLTEMAQPAATRNPIAAAWRELEHLSAARLPQAERIVLRAAPLAAGEGADGLGRALARATFVAPPGYDPAVQLLSPDDLAAAVASALRAGAGKAGLYNVAPSATAPVRAVLRHGGVRCVAAALAGGGRDYLRHNWTVSGAKIASELGFLPRFSTVAAVEQARRRPPRGQPAASYDAYGLDQRYIAAYGRTLFRFLHDHYWRVDYGGLEHVPREGAAVLTGVHRGFMPWDGVMALHLLVREIGRYPRFLIHPTLLKFPFLANYMTKLGGILACQANADWVLGQGELLGMFPEGIQGAFTRYRDAYRLGRFGRDEYVKMALRHRAPLVPFVTVGSAEIYPILGKLDVRWARRFSEWPCLPICPNFPLPGLPLPSKWHTRFLEPVPVDAYPPEKADDPVVVRALSDEVRARLQAAIDDLRSRRTGIFFGALRSAGEVARTPARNG